MGNARLVLVGNGFGGGGDVEIRITYPRALRAEELLESHQALCRTSLSTLNINIANNSLILRPN